jgi:hypothetical protein
MILFIIIAICILAYTLFADDWLIYHIKDDIKYKYHTFRKILGDIGTWILVNIVLNILNAFIVIVISFVMFIVLFNTCPTETSEWDFNINALQDNIVTEGVFYGRRGSVDGELSYFYSRTLSKGEKIEHIPADKTYVQYSNEEYPHVEVHQSRVVIPEWMYKVFFLKWMNQKTTDYYVIVVPDGTIISTGQYEIDME